MKLKLFPFVILVLFSSLQVCAQSIDQHGRKIPAITAEVQSQFTILEASLDNKVSKDYSITTLDNHYLIDSANLADLYAVNTANSFIILYLPSISSLPNAGKAIITITDVAGNAISNPIYINPGGSDMISGSSSITITNNYETITLMAVPSLNMWIIK